MQVLTRTYGGVTSAKVDFGHLEVKCAGTESRFSRKEMVPRCETKEGHSQRATLGSTLRPELPRSATKQGRLK